MKKEVAEKWAEALLSRKFKQGMGSLDCGGSYCCLGVLCLIAEKEGVKVSRGISGDIIGNILGAQPLVKHWSGLKSENGRFFENPEKQEELTFLNDSGKSFKTIAKIIKEHWEEL